MMHRAPVACAALMIFTVTLTSCVRVKAPAAQPSKALPGASLWQAPTDLPTRDLFYGPWGRDHAPDPDATYTFVELKHSGVNPGMTVRDPQGREWSVKQEYPSGLDPEAPVEVALSRVLSAIGYHQPPVYYLRSFLLKNDWGVRVERGGRFRLDEKSLKSEGPWSWQDNPFIGTRPYHGLLVLMMMFNATDLKDSNNTLYEYKRGDKVERWYVARDIGAALGDTARYAPRKGHPPSFERHPFIVGVTNGHVDFAYKGWYQKLVRDRITPDDVKWASDLLARLSERQWREAFRAGGYDPETADRFIRTLQKKIDQGRDVTRRAFAE